MAPESVQQHTIHPKRVLLPTPGAVPVQVTPPAMRFPRFDCVSSNYRPRWG